MEHEDIMFFLSGHWCYFSEFLEHYELHGKDRIKYLAGSEQAAMCKKMAEKLQFDAS